LQEAEWQAVSAAASVLPGNPHLRILATYINALQRFHCPDRLPQILEAAIALLEAAPQPRPSESLSGRQMLQGATYMLPLPGAQRLQQLLSDIPQVPSARLAALLGMQIAGAEAGKEECLQMEREVASASGAQVAEAAVHVDALKAAGSNNGGPRVPEALVDTFMSAVQVCAYSMAM
jgi:hypothetical protein